jgi:hypothetical protein
MSAGESQPPPTMSTTDTIVVTGDRHRVDGDVKHVARIILDAARGSIVQLAWLTDSEAGSDLAVNP